MWLRFDDDGSGMLDAKEIREVLRAFGKDLNDDEFEVAMQEIDEDGSGEVEFEEFQLWWKYGAPQTRGPRAPSYLLTYDSSSGVWRPPTDFTIVLTPLTP